MGSDIELHRYIIINRQTGINKAKILICTIKPINIE